MLLKVSRPFAIAKTLDFFTLLFINQFLLAAASVVLSPGAPAPIVYILGASLLLKIIFNDKLAPKIYTIGAGAPGDRTTEAAACRTWLVSNGVKKSNILAITKGRDTLSSTKAYAAQMKKANLSSVVIVTDPYHCYRVIKMAKDLGVTPTCSPVKSGVAAVENSSFKYLARETGAYLAYVTVGRLGIKLSDRS